MKYYKRRINGLQIFIQFTWLMENNYNLKSVTISDRIGYCFGFMHSHLARIVAAIGNLLKKVEDYNFGINLNEREYEALKKADANNINSILGIEKNLIEMERHFKKLKTLKKLGN